MVTGALFYGTKTQKQPKVYDIFVSQHFLLLIRVYLEKKKRLKLEWLLVTEN